MPRPTFAAAEGLAGDLRRWRESTGRRVPVYGAILAGLEAMLAEDAALRGRFAEAWRDRAFPALYDRPLLILASLREDALASGAAHPLFAALAAATPDAAAATERALRAALAREAFWTALGERRVQTNETSRAVAWLLPALLAGCSGGARPLALFDMGCSAGLNLAADALANIWTDAETGAPLEIAEDARVLARVGFDARPLDARREADARWLRACVWPTETARLARLEEAIAAMRRAGGVQIERRDLAEAPARLAALSDALPAGAFALAYQSIVRDYLPEATREAYYEGMRAWLGARPPGLAAWAEHETVDGKAALPAGIAVHVRAGGGVLRVPLTRSDYHPREVRVDRAGAERLRRLLGGVRSP